MADAQLLTQLHDIHLPAAIGWWPLAPGWYVLIISLLLLAGIFFAYSYRRRGYGRAKREALQLLANLQNEYRQHRNSQLSSMKISELLRRVALVYFPRQQIASLQGNEWIEFLNTTSKKIDFYQVSELLLQVPYQLSTERDLDPLFTRARAWIKQRGVPCSN
ncbi:DUF4381 domain-containing protein [Legionella cardiaca]|uniref:DUF4381 domain-containing protein n=1 Tax=Legionella cardiaca TaxID=1071983 RepID=A0ABY8AUH5_9GAMM|nr:DUF4381 domain-containing protein [Legionella cardiaca]WED43041.1 DUF4381 domain-containing protein [Legionella cardiaca]